jgi:hypothetical protein
VDRDQYHSCEIGENQHRERENNTFPTKRADDRRPNQIKLLFDGHRPQRTNNGMNRPSPRDYAPVSGEQEESSDIAPTEAVDRVQRWNQGEPDTRKVERPNTQHATDVKCAHVERAALGFFPEQQFGDEVRAEHEEQIDPETPGVRDAVRQSQPPRPPATYRDTAGQSESGKRRKKRESQDVEFGAIERVARARRGTTGVRRLALSS